MAKAEKLKPLELELRKLEDLAEAVVNDFARMKMREQEHRDTNGMSSNLHSLSVSTFLILVAVSRIHQRTPAVVQPDLHGCIARACSVAGAVPQALFPPEEAHLIPAAIAVFFSPRFCLSF